MNWCDKYPKLLPINNKTVVYLDINKLGSCYKNTYNLLYTKSCICGPIMFMTIFDWIIYYCIPMILYLLPGLEYL